MLPLDRNRGSRVKVVDQLRAYSRFFKAEAVTDPCPVNCIVLELLGVESLDP